jgi:hypothetical protein
LTRDRCLTTSLIALAKFVQPNSDLLLPVHSEETDQSKCSGGSILNSLSSATLTRSSEVGGGINECIIVRLTSYSRSLICIIILVLTHPHALGGPSLMLSLDYSKSISRPPSVVLKPKEMPSVDDAAEI